MIVDMSPSVETKTPSELEASESSPVVMGRRLADPAPLAMGGFATTLITLTFGMMNFRDVELLTLNIANLCFVACVGLLISAQWEMVRGNTFSYTVLSAYGLYYGGYGFILLPTLKISDPFGGTQSAQYNNAFGFYILMWSVFNLFFLIASTTHNRVQVGIFVALQFSLVLNAASYFCRGNGSTDLYWQLQNASGAFGFIAGLLGYYACAHQLCSEALPFPLPMGQFKPRNRSVQVLKAE